MASEQSEARFSQAAATKSTFCFTLVLRGAQRAVITGTSPAVTGGKQRFGFSDTRQFE